MIGFTVLHASKRIKTVLSRCEWGHDDYDLKIANLPQAPHPTPLPEGEGGKQPEQQEMELKST